MRQSESINDLAVAMSAAQAEMGGAVKDSANPFFKSKYADLTSVVKAIKEPFANHGLSYTQFPCAADGCVGVTTRLMHSSGQWLESEYMLPMVKNDPQAAGSAITYARRYALQAMAGIPTADDDAESAMLRGNEQPPVDERKQAHDAAFAKHHDSVSALQAALAEAATGGQADLIEAAFYRAYEAWSEIPDEDKQALYLATTKGGCLTTKERAQMKSDDWGVARRQFHGQEEAS